jgi:parallel beta-helix repeat protein
MHRATRRLAVLAAASALAVAAGTGTATADAGTCTRVAAPGGSDSAAGTEAAPFASAQQLVDSLGPGDVGCLRQGTYEEDVTINHGGTGEDSRVVVRSFPGERAKVSGRFYVPDRANYVTIEGLDLDGHDSPACAPGSTCTNLPSPTVDGDHVIFQDNDVTNRHVGICFNLGAAGYGRGEDDVIQRNRIHDCGRIDPVSNHDHGIYLAYSDGAKILSNVIYDNADRGIQLYPDAQGSLIQGNIIDGNGEGVIFSGAGSTTSNDNVVVNNVITNSKLRHDVESWYPDLIGTGNKVHDNCVHGGAQGPLSNGYGFDIGTNLKVDPKYVDRSGKDFRLAADSPCTAVLGGAPLPAEPGFRTDKPSGDPGTGTGDGTGSGSGDPPPHAPVAVTVSHATLRHSSRHHGHWGLRITGHVRGVHGPHRGLVQVNRGGRWERLAAHRLHRFFRFRVNPRIPRGLHAAQLMRVRVVVPGVGTSRPVAARVLS